ncbi:MAG: HEAT repeat domain-containing protein [Bdellovibrionia bacterium]
MKKKTLIQGFVIFGILIASAIMKFTGVGEKRPISEKERFESVLRQDRKALKDKKSSDSEIYSALVRLAAESDPLARSESLVRIKSESSRVRAGSANALGFFEDDQSLEGIKSLLGDREPLVRIQALTGLGHRATSNREALVLEVLKRKNLSEEEREIALSTLVQVAHSDSARGKALLELISAAQKQVTPKGRAAAAAQAIAVAPRDPRVIKMLEEILKSGATPALESSGIRHLAAVGNSWLKANMDKLSFSQNPETRLAVVQSLHAVCPQSRFDILQRVFEKDKDINVRSAALNELEYLLGSASVNFLEKLVENKSLEMKIAGQLHSILKKHKATLKVGSEAGRDLCKTTTK